MLDDLLRLIGMKNGASDKFCKDRVVMRRCSVCTAETGVRQKSYLKEDSSEMTGEH